MKYVRRILLAVLILLILIGGTIFVIITFYKKELSQLLTETLKSNYGLALKVEDVKVSFFSNWPHASVKLKNIEIKSEFNKTSAEPVLKAGSLSLSFDIKKMLRKQFVLKYVSIADAEVNMIRYIDGSRNFEFKKQDSLGTAKTSAISFEVKEISVKTTKFRFLNQQREQRIAIHFMDVQVALKQYLDGLRAEVNGKTVVEQLLFNAKAGEFLKNTRAILHLKLNYINDKNTLCVYQPSFIEIEGHQYRTTALLNVGTNRQLALQIESEKVKTERVAALLTPKIRKVLSNFEVKRPVDAKILLVVNLGKKEEPVILADIIGRDCDLSIGKSKIPYSGLNFHGRVISLDSSRQKGDAEHARILFNNLRGKIYDFPFTATVNVNNFVNPQIAIDASLLIEAKKIKFEVARNFELKGTALATIRYQGPSKKLNKEQFLEQPMKLNAYLLFNNLSYKEMDRPYVYTVNGKANLDNRDLRFEKLHLNTSVAEANIKGRAENFVPYVLGFTKGFKASLDASTEKLDLNSLLRGAENKEVERTEAKGGMTEKISNSWFEFQVNLSAKKLLLRKVVAENASVNLLYKNNDLEIRSLNVDACDGRITARGTIRNLSKINADVSIQNVNVKKLFDQFENFGQTAIGSENLQGTLFVDGKFGVELDEKKEFVGSTMVGDAKLKLLNGHLVNYEPIQKLSNFIFRNRDFNDVSFTELNETFKIRGYEMEIDELEIGSNVLNLYVVNGLYNVKGNSNINILIPWSNLKRRGKNYIPKNSGESAENTKGLKLNFYGPSKNMKISLGHKAQEKTL